jgi:A/G-specific adenine glycosylase
MPMATDSPINSHLVKHGNGADRADAGRWADSEGQQTAALLLGWFDANARVLPWRQNKDPYRIWLSEIMLQQTQVQTVIPYYEKFLRSWPTIRDLAAAPLSLVLKQWEGLGYYARARGLHEAAGLVSRKHGGFIPQSEQELLKLPGIGEYTACAVLSIAFGQPAAAVDGNVARVFSRLAATPWLSGSLPDRREIRKLAERLLPPERPGDWNEALMDLGATICLPRQPRCGDCPLSGICLASRSGRIGEFPATPARKARPGQNRVVLVLVRQRRALVRQRPPKGLLAGLSEFLWIDGVEPFDETNIAEIISRSCPGAKISPLGVHRHDFTHLIWHLTGFLAELPDDGGCSGLPGPDDQGAVWASAAELAALPFPAALSPFREKVLQALDS